MLLHDMQVVGQRREQELGGVSCTLKNRSSRPNHTGTTRSVNDTRNRLVACGLSVSYRCD